MMSYRKIIITFFTAWLTAGSCFASPALGSQFVEKFTDFEGAFLDAKCQAVIGGLYLLDTTNYEIMSKPAASESLDAEVSNALTPLGCDGATLGASIRDIEGFKVPSNQQHVLLMFDLFFYPNGERVQAEDSPLAQIAKPKLEVLLDSKNVMPWIHVKVSHVGYKSM